MSRLMYRLLLARLRHAGRRWVLVVATMALATSLSVLSAAAAAVAAQQAFRQVVEDLPQQERSVVVSLTPAPNSTRLAEIDGLVAANLAALGAVPVARQLVAPDLTAAAADPDGRATARSTKPTDTALFTLVALEAVEPSVTLLDGALPGACTPARCPVLELVAEPTERAAPAENLPGSRPAVTSVEPPFVVVGRARLTDPLLLRGSLAPPPGGPTLLAQGVAAVADLPAVADSRITVGWVQPFDLDRLGRLSAQGWSDAAARAADAMWTDGSNLVVRTPDRQLREVAARVKISGSRLGLLGGTGAVLLLGTAVVAGAALRRDLAAFRAVVGGRGLRGRHLATLLGGEILVWSLVGLGLGLLIGVLGAALIATLGGTPTTKTALAALRSAGWVLAGLAIAIAALTTLTLTVGASDARSWRTPHGSRRAVAVAAAVCLGGIALVAARGGVDAAAAGSGDALLVTLPALALATSGLVAAWLWSPVVRLTHRVLPQRWVGARLGMAASAGRPLRPTATVAVVTAAVGMAVFAGGYRASLDQGAADQARFAVPMDVRITPGPDGARPLDVVTPQQVSAAVGSGDWTPLLRVTASVRIGAQQAEPLSMIGLNPAILPLVGRWSALTGGGTDPEEAATALLSRTARGSGLVLTEGQEIRIATWSPVTAAVTAWVRADDGREVGVPLVVSRSGSTLTGRLPAWRDAAGRPAVRRLISLELVRADDVATRRAHGLENLPGPVPLNGRLDLGAVQVGGRLVAGSGAGAGPWLAWTVLGGDQPDHTLVVPGDADRLTLDYQLTQGSLIVQGRADGPGGGIGLPVVVDPLTAAAAPGGLLTVVLDGRSVDAEVVGVLDRFPTAGKRFAVAEMESVARLADLVNPGSGQPGELWLAADPVAGGGQLTAAIDTPEFTGLAVQLRIDRERRLREDVIASSSASLLTASAVIALLVAALTLVLMMQADREDDATQAYALEADGVRPSTLRAALWWRAVTVLVPGTLLGILAGVALSRLAVGLVAVSADGRTPLPPLVPVAGTMLDAGLVAAGVLLMLVPAAVVAARSLREPLPVRAGPSP